ncbi:hypothetical protein [Rhodobacter capsulatus]|uniref:hypothetical protein n=1 Tax=Rhodobacter capsulatus TaxID=1061 RepID=UPI0040285563
MKDLPMKDLPLSPATDARAAPAPAAPWQDDVLAVLRLMIDSYRAPERDGWCLALDRAQARWGETRGAIVFADLAQVLSRLRVTRHSPFGFGRVDGSQPRPTRHEALFLQVARLSHAGHATQAEAVATLLCEGNEVTAYLTAVRRLVAHLD